MSKKKDILISLQQAEHEQTDLDRTIIQGVKDLTPFMEKREACLIVISGASAGKMFKLTDNMCIGRAKECEIFLEDEGISRQHAVLERDAQGNAILTDLNSTNGTYFNGVRINQHLLRDGDKIQIGSTTILKYSYQDSLEEAFHQNQYEAATKDGLTRVYNKKYFIEQLNKDFSYALRHNEIVSLVVFDIDHFKQINDSYGHQAGDMVLRKLAQLVNKILRKEDVLARIGGEEFGIILRQVDEKRAHVLAERIRRTVELFNFIWMRSRLKVTISLGVASLRHANFREPSELLHTADKYLYKAKNLGRNRVSSLLR